MIRGQDQVEEFDNSFFRFNYDLTSSIENIGSIEKKYVNKFFEFRPYPTEIGKTHKFFLWSSRKEREDENEVSIIIEHWCRKKRVDSISVMINLHEYDIDKRYRFLYLSEEKVENLTRNMAKITPGWWTMKSMFMNWKWFQDQIELISNEIDKKITDN